jgi:RNA polymerase sigma factor (sigma-70 family)
MLYARRHVGVDDAPDVVAEAFTVAWRRWSEVPDPALPWLIGTARRCIQNLRRTRRRQDALIERIRLLDAVAAEEPAGLAGQRHDALVRLAGLSEQHREAILLVSWDGLTIEQAATAAGVRPATFRVRLHRARRALEPSIHIRAAKPVEEIS